MQVSIRYCFRCLWLSLPNSDFGRVHFMNLTERLGVTSLFLFFSVFSFPELRSGVAPILVETAQAPIITFGTRSHNAISYRQQKGACHEQSNSSEETRQSQR